MPDLPLPPPVNPRWHIEPYNPEYDAPDHSDHEEEPEDG